MPELIDFQKSKTSNIFTAVPQYFLARNDLLIMEDLRCKGFKMADRKAGLTLDECKFALKQIAILHSMSLGYKFERPKQFAKLKSLVKEQIFCEANEIWYKDYYIQLTKNAIAMVSDVLPKNSKYIKKLKGFVESSTFFSHMIELASKESLLSVICHGDCWTNNFLYRYDDKGEVIEMSLVDFQLIRYGSVALDIADIIYCCINKSMRDEHLDSLLRIYTNELYKSLKSFGSLPDHFDTEEKCLDLFKIELKSYGKFALGIALDIIPISTCSPEDAPDLYLEKNDETFAAPTLNFPPNDLCRKKFCEIIIDLVDSEIL